MPKKKQKGIDLSLKDWILEMGESEVAKLLKINVATVGHWRRGYCLPTVDKQKRIVEITRGRLSFETMALDFLSDENKGRRPTVGRKYR